MSSENGDVLEDGVESPYRVEVRGVEKSYRLGELLSLQKTVRYVASQLSRKWRPTPRFEALAPVNFEIAAGECFAIVGSNGSGKSTLARIIAGITIPSAGEIITRGRVLPLFHIKGGFQAELTARENVTMFASLLGMSRSEIRTALPRIAEFAEIDEEHLDTPVKRFSTGQAVRTAFATTLGLPADIYLFDEVLNAADDTFKGRCAEEIRRLVKHGASVVFISHELDLVKAICTRGIWLENGRQHMTAPIDELATAYHKHTEAHLHMADGAHE